MKTRALEKGSQARGHFHERANQRREEERQISRQAKIEKNYIAEKRRGIFRFEGDETA